MFIQVAAMVLLGMFVGLAQAQEKPVPKTDKEKLSYSLGLNIGANYRRQGVGVDLKALSSGVTDGLTGAKPALSLEEVQRVLGAFQQQMAARAQQISRQIAEKNKKEGEAFLAENKKKKGVVTRPSGLQYKVIQEGTGTIPKAGDTIVTNYRGMLVNGTEFDSSVKHGGPVSFTVTDTGVIKGWNEALRLMKVGSKWQIFVPADLAYGSQGVPQFIAPNSTLVFDIELVAIKK